ncbi:metal-binding protein ZinT [Bacillus sp. T33-2]|nr:metal-binding protein ZinT [Bacillus sp. T33-2]
MRKPFHPKRLLEWMDEWPVEVVRAKGLIWLAIIITIYKKECLSMKSSFVKGLCILSISSLLVACQTTDSSEGEYGDETTTYSSVSDSSEAQEKTHENEHEHDHSHAHDEETEQIYDGYFKDSQVKDRSLSDWEGDWQSVYPYLQDGTLSEVFAYKAEHEGDMTAEEYKEYYNKGYQTDVDRILIKEDTVTFFKNGKEFSGEYIYDGYEILTYDAGNRGVRYIFKLQEKAEGLPQYIQFSDHSIYPNEASHYHMYWGDDREALLDEVINWPTYYPSEMDGHDIAHEMMTH